MFYDNYRKIEHTFQEFPNIFDIFTSFKLYDTLSLVAPGFWYGGSIGNGSEGASALGWRGFQNFQKSSEFFIDFSFNIKFNFHEKFIFQNL